MTKLRETLNALNGKVWINTGYSASGNGLGKWVDLKKFEVGKTYSTRSVCDHNCIFSHKILRRTSKTVTIKVHGKIVRRKMKKLELTKGHAGFNGISWVAKGLITTKGDLRNHVTRVFKDGGLFVATNGK